MTELHRPTLLDLARHDRTSFDRAVVVSALSTEARGWWQRLGFRAFDPAENECLDLYLLTADIEATLRR